MTVGVTFGTVPFTIHEITSIFKSDDYTLNQFSDNWRFSDPR